MALATPTSTKMQDLLSEITDEEDVNVSGEVMKEGLLFEAFR